MFKPAWVDYSGAAPILLPTRLLGHWRGFYLPAGPDESMPDLVLPDGSYKICSEFDFQNPKTDYDRACALGGKPPVHPIIVGPGIGLVFATHFDRLTWCPDERMIVNGGALPAPGKLGRVAWSEALGWETSDSDFVLMNACYHGADPAKGPHFRVSLSPGRYTVGWGEYGWGGDDPALLLFRFVTS
jgi:hypothetical protein